MFFDDVKVPVGNLVGEEGRGWDCAKYLLLSERVSVASVGQCWERLNYARELAGRRRAAGQRLRDDPKFGAELAVLGAEVRAMELTAWRFLMDPDISRTNPGFASVLKLKGSELIQEITTLLARLSGLSGLERRSSDGEAALHPDAALVSRYFFYRATSIYGGSSEVQKDILAKTILG